MKFKFKNSLKFSLTIAVITFVLAAVFSIVSSFILGHVSWIFGLFIVLIIVLIGIVFDMLGIASTAADEAPFHAMAAEKVNGAKEAVIIVKNADKFSSFCSDVIGDIAGIISGSATLVVILEISNLLQQSEGSAIEVTLSVILTSIVAALTVGGKAIGKFFAINASTTIVMVAGKASALLQNKLKINILPKQSKPTKEKNLKNRNNKGNYND